MKLTRVADMLQAMRMHDTDMRLIRVADMLQTMQMRDTDGQRIPFSITFVTCDLKKDEGGNKITLKKAVLVGASSSKSTAKNPQHYANYTRNIKVLGGDRLIKMHPILVTKFNGWRVCQ